MNEEMLKVDGFDDAIIGHAEVWQAEGQISTLIYSGEKMVKILMDRDGMPMDEAEEYLYFNVEGAYMGPSTPIIMWETHE